jgi:hypothetical protein
MTTPPQPPARKVTTFSQRAPFVQRWFLFLLCLSYSVYHSGLLRSIWELRYFRFHMQRWHYDPDTQFFQTYFVKLLINFDKDFPRLIEGSCRDFPGKKYLYAKQNAKNAHKSAGDGESLKNAQEIGKKNGKKNAPFGSDSHAHAPPIESSTLPVGLVWKDPSSESFAKLKKQAGLSLGYVTAEGMNVDFSHYLRCNRTKLQEHMVETTGFVIWNM